jgi:hypothetical protein
MRRLLLKANELIRKEFSMSKFAIGEQVNFAAHAMKAA